MLDNNAASVTSPRAGSKYALRLLGSEPTTIILITVGIAVRTFWCLERPYSGASGEAFNVAAAIGTGRGFSDAYRVGQGATAHLLPISPSVAGLVYAMFGVRTAIAEFILACWSIGLAIGTYVLFFRAFERLGTPTRFRYIGLAVACLGSPYVSQEAVDFRVWDGGLAAFVSALFLTRLLALDPRRPLSWNTICIMTALAAISFFVNPIIGLAVYLCALIYLVRRGRAHDIARTAVVGGLTLALLIVPWTVRNKAEMGEALPLRSNSGLELAIANNNEAAFDPDRGKAFSNTLTAIHPALSQKAFRTMKSVGGEVKYSRRLGQEASAWIYAHPGAAGELALRHIRQIIAPESWQFATFGTGRMAQLRAVIATIVGTMGSAGILWRILKRQKDWYYCAAMAFIPSLVLCLFQPVPRYTYLIFPILIFCSADLLSQVFNRFLEIRSKPDVRSNRGRI